MATTLSGAVAICCWFGWAHTQCKTYMHSKATVLCAGMEAPARTCDQQVFVFTYVCTCLAAASVRSGAFHDMTKWAIKISNACASARNYRECRVALQSDDIRKVEAKIGKADA